MTISLRGASRLVPHQELEIVKVSAILHVERRERQRPELGGNSLKRIQEECRWIIFKQPLGQESAA